MIPWLTTHVQFLSQVGQKLVAALAARCHLNSSESGALIRAVDGGGLHTLVLLDNGQVIAWGNNQFGQTNVPPTATNIVAIAAGIQHNVALRADGLVLVWGGSNPSVRNLPSFLNNVTAVAAANEYSLALLANGTVTQWGSFYKAIEGP